MHRMNDDGSACFARLLCVVTCYGTDAFFYEQSALRVHVPVHVCDAPRQVGRQQVLAAVPKLGL